ncbi:MAG: prepilin-type N-terminal cleavage/methylation domain-containing protein [Candidatus Omnitrophica bacterium]|nr:prepilin-type N-terminal cleavage/methylation domain-containing protein [Candidatus Omnitrophota bacterium]
MKHATVGVEKAKGHEAPKGFSLVELLAVSSLILVLLAVSVPQFRQMSIFNDVAKVKSDIHFLVAAQEVYYQDYGIYPAESESDTLNRPRPEAGLFWLTTPTPYIVTVPEDPFGLSPGMNYYETGGIEIGVTKLSCTPCLETWVIMSLGPSGIQTIRTADPHYPGRSTDSIASYNPTNGTESLGNIFQYGGDPFWIGVVMSSVNRTVYATSSGSLDRTLDVDGVHYLHRLPPPLK